MFNINQRTGLPNRGPFLIYILKALLMPELARDTTVTPSSFRKLAEHCFETTVSKEQKTWGVRFWHTRHTNDYYELNGTYSALSPDLGEGQDKFTGFVTRRCVLGNNFRLVSDD